jgi:sporulation protein YlmC with PRC-barrel domain
MIGSSIHLIHKPVWDSAGKYLGEVDEVYIDPATLNLSAIGVGDMLIARKAIQGFSDRIVLNCRYCTKRRAHRRSPKPF